MIWGSITFHWSGGCKFDPWRQRKNLIRNSNLSSFGICQIYFSQPTFCFWQLFYCKFVPIVISVILTTWLPFLLYWHLHDCKPNNSDGLTKLRKKHRVFNCRCDDGILSVLKSQDATVTPTQDSLPWAEWTQLVMNAEMSLLNAKLVNHCCKKQWKNKQKRLWLALLKETLKSHLYKLWIYVHVTYNLTTQTPLSASLS